MKFSSLKKSQAAYDTGDITRIENKQRINLSGHAYGVLLHDMDIFQLETNNQGEVCSELINHIFANFHSQAESSIAAALQEQRSSLLDQLSAMGDLTAREEAVDLLLKAYTAELEQWSKDRCAQKDHSITFRVSKKNMDYLLSDEGQREGGYYRDNVGAYSSSICHDKRI